ncbi:MAG: TetR/AcrR family transcriptional regulator [Spirochaetales bacterium]|uniref:TetR/AcrR family transcriptional regulator n=1 Tax=Bullifex sp. TaxID=2815808 RepID=UPI002A531258|nr:TetR/AcrR family transcriptional regulator [Bullifex sp.]MDD5973027.1 TetR/AcrR family transcriptional regulator [Spirochaetales bacterium]MDD7271194.1 TetR/AcrR family transcriptional regulator [Spirochaetales bacterium]MDY4066565.1 TetR/AcrR family transcriptional regulator [Bullifex sp.]
MPKTYTKEEKDNIRQILLEEAEIALAHSGIESITVDSLVEAASIPKGSFYLFYSSKEELFLDVVSTFRKDSEEKTLSLLAELDENHIVTSLTEVFTFLTNEIIKKGIFRIVDEKQQAIIRKKVGKKRVEEVLNDLFSYFKELFSYFAIDDKDDLEGFYSAYLLLLYSFLHKDKIKDLEASTRLILRGLILQLVGE